MTAPNTQGKNIVVIASKADLDFVRIASALWDAHYELRVAEDELHLGDLVLDPSCAVVFLDDDFCRHSLAEMRRFAPHSGAKWVYCVRKDFSEATNQLALKEGAFLVLNQPTAPQQYVIRTKQALLGQHAEPSLRPVLDIQMRRKKRAPRVVYDRQAYPSVGVDKKPPAAASVTAERWKLLFGEFLFNAKHRQLSEVERNMHRALSMLASLSQSCLMTLHSLRPTSPLDQSRSRVRCLSSSARAHLEAQIEPITEYPELRWAAQTGEVVFVSNRRAVDAYAKCAQNFGDKGVVAIPLKSDEGEIVGVLRLSFPAALDGSMRAFAHDVSAFSSCLLEGFSKLDFFSRIYSAPENFYQDQRA